MYRVCSIKIRIRIYHTKYFLFFSWWIKRMHQSHVACDGWRPTRTRLEFLSSPSEMFTILGIAVAHLRGLLKPLDTIMLWCTARNSYFETPWFREKLESRGNLKLTPVETRIEVVRSLKSFAGPGRSYFPF